MEIAEIVAATGMHVNTGKTHLHRAVKVVRERVGDDEDRYPLSDVQFTDG